jgi:8-amino-7-oxononanoate synthase
MPIMQSAPGAKTVIDGREYLYFAGTGYLGLQGHPELIRAACDATQQYGLGTATSRRGYGDAPPTLQVESEAAIFSATEDAFFFPSGYVGNHVLVSGLVGSADAIFLDEATHYSVQEAARLSGLPTFVFPHADPEGLQDVLQRNLKARQRPLVMTDGVFSALGTIAPLRDYDNLLRDYDGAKLCVDDCHGFGVLGKLGRGTFEHFGFEPHELNNTLADDDPPTAGPQRFVAATLSKALGAYGGIICGSQEFIRQARAASHYYDGASGPPIAAAAAAARALQLVRHESQMIRQVQENAIQVKQGLRNLGLEMNESPAPIACLTLETAANMQRIQQALMSAGILIAYQPRYAGLPPAGALRIAVFATHTKAMIEQLLNTLRKIL